MTKPNPLLEVLRKQLISVPVTRETKFYRDSEGNLRIRIPPSKQN